MEADLSNIEKTQKEALEKYQNVDYRIRKLQVCNFVFISSLCTQKKLKKL